MSAKFFQKQIRPDIINGDVSGVIQSNAADKPFSTGDVVFDWQALDLPKGTDAIVNGSIHMYGEDGGPSTSKDFYLLIAKSNNGVAPTSLGDTNAAVTGCYELGDILLGVIKFEGNTHGQGIINLNKESIYYYNIGSSSGQSGVTVIETGVNPSGVTRGTSTQRIYVAGIAGGAHDFSTGVLLNDASDVADDSATTLTVDGVDPRKAFRAGDTVYIHDSDTPIGTVASLTANSIVLTSNNVGAIADDDEFMNAAPMTIKLGFRNPR
tara:strand:+ start:24 stop:821 length:798 start_codon:yes stop_codon:yes gene_type:complete